MTSFPTAKWDRRNCQVLPSGEVVVREALVNLAINLPSSGAIYLGGQTVKNPRNGQVWHYCLVSESSVVSIYVLDDAFATRQKIALSNVPANLDRYALCVTEVGDELLITSPFFQTYWGPKGSGLALAVKQASINSSNTTALDVPKGISVGWAGRAVVADGEALWFSDALAPRTFVAENALSFPGGQVFGLHVNAGGALIICSEQGTFALSEQAAATGQIVVGIFQKLSDHNTTEFETTCSSQGKVWGLGEKGIEQVDVQGTPTLYLDEDIINRFNVPRIHFQDYRSGRLYPTLLGNITSLDGYTHLMESSAGFRTWLMTLDSVLGNTQKFKARGVLHEDDGEEILLMEVGPLWRDGERYDLFGANEFDFGFVAGRLNFPPNNSLVIRKTFMLSDSRNAFSVNHLGVIKSGAVPAQSSPIIGTDSWGTGLYTEAPLRNTRLLWNVRTRELAFEIRIRGAFSKIPETIDVEFAGPGRERP